MLFKIHLTSMRSTHIAFPCTYSHLTLMTLFVLPVYIACAAFLFVPSMPHDPED